MRALSHLRVLLIALVALLAGACRDFDVDLDGDGYIDCRYVLEYGSKKDIRESGCVPHGDDPIWDDPSDGVPRANARVHDCDDQNPDTHPDAVEICDGLDNDCDGLFEEWDERVDPLEAQADLDCDGDGYVFIQTEDGVAGDCTPWDAASHPDEYGDGRCYTGRDADDLRSGLSGCRCDIAPSRFSFAWIFLIPLLLKRRF